MKPIFKLSMAGAVFALASTAAMAADNLVTRSVEDAHADLMRTYTTHGGPPAGIVRTRSPEAANADLMRDYGAKTSNADARAVQTRSKEASYIDLMRMWGALPANSN